MIAHTINCLIRRIGEPVKKKTTDALIKTIQGKAIRFDSNCQIATTSIKSPHIYVSIGLAGWQSHTLGLSIYTI